MGRLKDRTDGELFDNNNNKLSTCNQAGLSTWFCNLLGSDSDIPIQSRKLLLLSGEKHNPSKNNMLPISFLI